MKISDEKSMVFYIPIVLLLLAFFSTFESIIYDLYRKSNI